MNCKVGEHAGFCFGANRAVESLEDALKENKPIYTYGPILNNDILVESYKKRGVTVVDNIEEFDNLPKGKIIIRSHGVGRDIYESLVATGFEIFDATCPFVKRIHRIVEKQSQLGDKIVVVGNPRHPEVMGIVGWVDGNDAYVVEKEEDIDKLNFEKSDKITLVSQTTFNRNKFQELVEIFEKRSYNIDVMNTICDATRVRQEEADALSKEADVMIVIGDEKSSNSRKLYDICRANCDQTFFIQTLEDIKGRLNVVSNLVGITAGASTPKYIIEEVQKYVRNDF